MSTARIRAIASCLPERVVTNEELAERLQLADPDEIFRNTGIRERRAVAEGECASDLATRAARKLLDSGAVRPEDVEFVLFCSQTPDYYLPTTACLIQDRLGLPKTVGASDIAQGCSGYVMGLAFMKGLIESGQIRGGLLLTGDSITRFANPRDRSVATLFGDAGTATFLSSDGPGGLLGVTVFGSDGKGGPSLMIPAGGSRLPRSAETGVEHTDASGNIRSQNDLYMDGKEIFASRSASFRKPSRLY
ncbi:MAG: ketoacyl-ACP synthase III [Bryobacterales bacterium]